MKAKKKSGRPVSRARKLIFVLIGILLVVALIWLGYYLIHYQFYNKYETYLSGYEVEEATEYQPLKDSSVNVDGMELVAENDYLKLYTNTKTAEVAVYDKRTQTTVYSNPQGSEDDPIANGVNKNYLKSQFVLDYYNAARTAGTYDSYSMSVEKGNFEVFSLENGVRYVYTLGEESSVSYYVPYFLSGEWYDKIMAAVDEADQKTFQRLYTASKTLDGGYELISAAKNNKKSQAKVDAVLQKAGFTEEDYYEQMALGGEEASIPMSFVVTLDYKLNEDSIEVSIPVSELEENGGGNIYRIQLLRSFAAAGTDETGYMVVPNGSGSIINFNNGKTNTASYSQYVYGIDLLDADYTVLENTTNVRLPMFGICRENSSVLATIENGQTMCFITSDVAGKYNSYNYTYPTFVVRGDDTLEMFGVSGTSADMPIIEPELYDEKITVRYTMLTDEYQGYSGIANYYRERLIEEGVLTVKEESGDIPFYYDVIGGVKQTASIFGAQYLRVYPMTTFEEAGKMSDSLAEKGVTNQVMNFQGWFNGGYYHDVADKVNITSKLGGKSGLEELNATVSENGGRFYGDVAFQNVTFISKRFQYSTESSRYYGSGYVAAFGQVNPTTLRRTSGLGYTETKYDLLSPKYLPRYVDKFSKRVSNLEMDGISLRDLGDELHSDKRRTNVISREQALEVVKGQFETLESTGKNLMVSGGNDYSFGYVKDIINAPTADNDFFIVDEMIPLYEMIIHGCIDYCGVQQNVYTSDDSAKDVLEAIEYGSSCHFIFTWENATEMKYTGLNRYYSTTFTEWEDTAVTMYQEINDALKHVSNAQMIKHEILDEDVRKVTYDNGVTIYINYGETDVKVDNVSIPAKDYVLGGM